MTLLKNLKQAAEKATPGPWSFELFGCASSVIKKNQAKIQVICREPKDIDDCAKGNKDICGDNFEYIALASPDNVLKLIEALEEAKNTTRDLVRVLDMYHECANEFDPEQCETCAEIEAARNFLNKYKELMEQE